MGKKIQEPRTKGNVKPSKSDNAAQFLASKKLDNVQGFAGLAGGLGFVRTDNIDSDVDPELRQIFRRLDKKDTLTKQKALQELLSAVESHSESSLLVAFPYWPRLYSRLSQDADNKVRTASHKVMARLASRCGRNMAPHLKTVLPAWILGRGDDYEPAASAAASGFDATFPTAKRADALVHAWPALFDLAEESLISPVGAAAAADEEAAFAEESRRQRAAASSLKALSILLPLVVGKEAASSRLLHLLKEKRFWSHFAAGDESVRAAYLSLVSTLCRDGGDLLSQPVVAAAVCDVVLRHVDDASPLVARPLWTSLLLLLEALGDGVWRHVSLRKTFLPQLSSFLSSGGRGVARLVFPSLLPLFARLGLGGDAEDRATGAALLRRLWEGLHQPRVLVVSAEAAAVAQAFMECLRFLVAEGVAANADVWPLIAEFALPALTDALETDKSFAAFGATLAEQTVLLLGLLHRLSPELFARAAQEVVSAAGGHEETSLPLVAAVGGRGSDGWAATLMDELAEAFLARAFSADRPQSWLPFLAAAPRIRDLSARFPPSEKSRAMLGGLEPLLGVAEEKKDLLPLIADGLAALLAQLTAEEAAERVGEEFKGMTADRRRLLFLSAALPRILLALPLPHATAAQQSLEPLVSAWASDLIAAVFAQLDSRAETTFAGVLHMLLHNIPAGMAALWRLRAELARHVRDAAAPLQRLTPKRRRRLAALLSHFLAACGEEAAAGGTAEVSEIVLMLHRRTLAMVGRPEAEKEEEETAEAAVRKTATQTVLSHLTIAAAEPTFASQLLQDVVEAAVGADDDEAALRVCQQYAVPVLAKMLQTDVDERPFLAAVTQELLRRAHLAHRALDTSVADNARFGMTLTTREMKDVRRLCRALFLLAAVADAHPDLEHAIPDAEMARLVRPALFAADSINRLNVGRQSPLIPVLNDFEKKHRRLPEDEDSPLSLMTAADMMRRQEMPLSDEEALNLDWLDDCEEEVERRVRKMTVRDLPALLHTDTEHSRRDVLLAAISARISAPLSPHSSALLSLLSCLGEEDPDSLSACLHLFLSFHAAHQSSLFPDSLPSGWRLDLLLASLHLLADGVRHGVVLDESGWDVVLCSAVSWLSLLPDEEDVSSRFAFHLLRLLAALGASLPAPSLPARIADEWTGFYAGHLYDAALHRFLRLLDAARADPVALLLCDAIAAAPVDRLLAWTVPARLRADEGSQIVEQTLLSIVNTLAPRLCGCWGVQVAACEVLTSLATAGKLSEPEAGMESEEAEFRPAQALVEAVEGGLWVCEMAAEAAEFGGGAVGLDRLMEAVEDEGEEGWEGEDHSNPVLTQLAGLLLSWRVLLSTFAASTPLVKAKFAAWLADTRLFDQLLRLLFRVLPLNPSVSRSKSLFESEVAMRLDPAVPFMRRAWLLHLAASVYMQVLRVAPALMRQWWLGLNKKESVIVEKYTERQISPILIQSETEIVNVRAPEVFPDQDVMSVKGKASIREIHAIYRVTEEHRTELLITLPDNFPLGPITVQTFKKIGISAQQWRSLQLQMTTFLQNQNGTVLEGLSLWKRNIDTKMEGVEDCMICFSILHGSNYQLPRMSCHTCKKKFHAACLYKWFQTSHNHTCPLCRNMFEMSRH